MSAQVHLQYCYSNSPMLAGSANTNVCGKEESLSDQPKSTDQSIKGCQDGCISIVADGQMSATADTAYSRRMLLCGQRRRSLPVCVLCLHICLHQLVLPPLPLLLPARDKAPLQWCWDGPVHICCPLRCCTAAFQSTSKCCCAGRAFQCCAPRIFRSWVHQRRGLAASCCDGLLPTS